MEAITSLSCNTATLAPYVPSAPNPWNVSKVKHVYRRLGFGAAQAAVDAALALSPSEFIDNLVDGAFNLPTTATPFWGNYAVSDFGDFETENEQYILDWRLQSANDFISEDLRGRLTFFWTNHFVTELEVYFYAPYLFQYYNIIQSHCVGNFKDFVHDIGINPAMLLYLNGFENTNFNPNENYARELYELFTLGEGNGYTEFDITETARALTGYNHWSEPGAAIYFDVATHDTGSKTIFNQTGAWDYEDVITILFQERGGEIAFNMCKKLYQFFVSPDVDTMIEQNIIQPLSQTLINNNFELVPVLKQLFKSQHFFDERALGVVIKSPYDVMFHFTNESDFFYDDTLMDAFVYYTGLMGQEIFNPPDVSGWQRDETWINSSTLSGRWILMELYVDYLFVNGHEFSFTDLARDLTNDSNDPEFITRVLVDHFLAKELYTPEDYDIATDIFKWEIPQNYYDEGLWNLSWSEAPFQVSLLLKHIARMPEFQLK
ncbi:MAG: DUF1800 domain-containing protein [Altibacter sp.]|uniref:DUF1800 domain-containing protein n=1 Tax=Altibacter sp. TaxID=2024823 RepID=UPI001DDCE0B7|nr:DUF1800 domain-containing protein [Altibacter sp.]MBZ0327916.1 DUF1800 domain-containing protein [Altibacter sp.]